MMRITIALPVLVLLSATERHGQQGASASLAPPPRALSLKRHRKRHSHAPNHAGAAVDHPCPSASSTAAWLRANDTISAFTDDEESSDVDMDYAPEFAVAPFEPETLRVVRNVLVLMLATVLLTGAAALSPLLSLSPAAAAAMRRDVAAGAAIFSIGDLLAQLLTGARLARLDGQRLALSTCLGAVWSGLCVPVVYTSAEGMFPGRSPARVLAKMAVTCSVLSTAGNYATMLARRWVQELLRHGGGASSPSSSRTASAAAGGRRSLGACVKSCNGDIGEVIMDDLKVWPLYDVACYALIPPSLRPITTAVMSSGWAMYMSIVSSRTSVSASAPPALPSSGLVRDGVDGDGGEIIQGLSRCAAA